MGVEVLGVAWTEAWDRVEVFEGVRTVLAPLIERRRSNIDVALLLKFSVALKVDAAAGADANVVLNILSVARVLVRVVRQQEVVGFLSDTEWLITLLGLGRLARLTHVVFLGHLSQLAVVVALRGVRFLKTVDGGLVAIDDALQDSGWARNLHVCDVNVVGIDDVLRVQIHGFVGNQVVLVVLADSGAICLLLFPEVK